jgi:hypothetical protein
MSVQSCRLVLVSDESVSSGRGNTSPTTQAHGNAALAQAESFDDLRTPGADRSLEGTGKITIGKKTSTFGYKVREFAEDLTEVAVTIGEGVDSVLKAIFRRPAIGVAAAGIGLAVAPGAESESKAALMLDGITRSQMTAPNPSMDGFLASATVSIAGIGQSPNNSSVTHLFGQYYAIGTHELAGGEISFMNLYPGRDYINDPGNPIGISSITNCPFADLSIITASTVDNSPRNPNTKLVGIALAQTGGTGNSGTTVYLHLADPDILGFISQVTGTTITLAEVQAGNSIIGEISGGDHAWGTTFGTWGTPSGGIFNPDGLAGSYQGVFDANGARPGSYQDPNLYFTTDFLNDGGASFGAMNGKALNLDSGSPALTVVPEPSTIAVLTTAAMAGILLRRRRG